MFKPGGLFDRNMSFDIEKFLAQLCGASTNQLMKRIHALLLRALFDNSNVKTASICPSGTNHLRRFAKRQIDHRLLMIS